MAGRGGVLAALPAAATWIDMTSSSPAVGRVLFDAAHARGIGVLEAPASGACRRPGEGELQLFVGGDAALVERHRPSHEVLADSQRIGHVGGHGAGYLAKPLVSVLWFGQAIATAEAFAPGPVRRDRPRRPSPRTDRECRVQRLHPLQPRRAACR
jgi:3-hydroxyisobutyrate dehydrogenase